jgi:Rhodopirellula transposase DDE domain
VGVDHDTATFEVNVIRSWWKLMGLERYPNANSLPIIADGGNGSRVRLWKVELQKLADERGVSITVSHLPPGASKWNKIERRLFSFITGNWRGKPLVSHQVNVQLIAATTTKTGLEVRCELDPTAYPAGVKVSGDELAVVNILRHDFHGEWNYKINPKANPLQQSFADGVLAIWRVRRGRYGARSRAPIPRRRCGEEGLVDILSFSPHLGSARTRFVLREG